MINSFGGRNHVILIFSKPSSIENHVKWGLKNHVRRRLSYFFFVSSSSRARATNTQIGQEENSGYTFLEVYGEDGADVPPEIVVPPRDKTVVRGTTLSELHCIANARPLHALEILWFKDGRPIDEVGVPFSFNDLWNRTLSLFEADFKHQGVYTCQARMTTG